MKKALILLLLVCIVLPVAAYAKSPHQDVDGYFSYMPAMDCTENEAADNLIWRNCTDEGEYDEGTFIGESTEVYDVIMHGYQGDDEVTGFPLFENGWYKGVVTFTGEVDEKSGTMRIMFVGKSPGNILVWSGTWRILGGEGDLKGIHGNGTWENTEVPLRVHYEGRMHFAP